jgi:hypothetical protein
LEKQIYTAQEFKRVIRSPNTHFRKNYTIVANVTVMKTSEMLLRFISRAVAKAVGTTAQPILGLLYIQTRVNIELSICCSLNKIQTNG